MCRPARICCRSSRSRSMISCCSRARRVAASTASAISELHGTRRIYRIDHIRYLQSKVPRALTLVSCDLSQYTAQHGGASAVVDRACASQRPTPHSERNHESANNVLAAQRQLQQPMHTQHTAHSRVEHAVAIDVELAQDRRDLGRQRRRHLPQLAETLQSTRPSPAQPSPALPSPAQLRGAACPWAPLHRSAHCERRLIDRLR